MGEVLEKIYNIVTNKAGNNGRLKLAEKTGMPRVKAVKEDDKPEVVAAFKKTASEILGKDIDEFL